MNAARPLPAGPETFDHFVYLRDVSWKEYEALLSMRGERSVPRITYLNGMLELMSPSRYHEGDKKKLARIIEAWAEEMDIPLEGIGSWTLKNSKEERGVEPDEWYTVRRVPQSDEDRPDFAIEVIWTSFLPDLDPDLIVHCMNEPSQGEAVRALRTALHTPS